MKYTFLLVVVLVVSNAFAQTEVTRTKHFNIKKGLALEGYDPVSYLDGKPLEGKEELKTTYKGVTYLFATAANLNKFKASPDKYEPAYGGWCAFAMGETGEKVKVDPETYTVKDGRVYLFYNFWGNNTLTDWNKNEQKLKDAADRNWKSLFR